MILVSISGRAPVSLSWQTSVPLAGSGLHPVQGNTERPRDIEGIERGRGGSSQGACILYSTENAGIEAVTAVTMKNVVFWDIKTQFVPHGRHITSPLQSPAS
jgi:hypothetical protein